ncbi:MAG: hypothetical protein Q7Q73_17240 [Verrucomicrobiota bacterium JB024]|nr:hypothetical protein [Verrucomicrobiota bacterium JB024]
MKHLKWILVLVILYSLYSLGHDIVTGEASYKYRYHRVETASFGEERYVTIVTVKFLLLGVEIFFLKLFEWIERD